MRLIFLGLLSFVQSVDLTVLLTDRRIAPLSGRCTKVRLIEGEADVREGIALMIPSLAEANSGPNPRDNLLRLATARPDVLARLTYILDGVYLPPLALDVLMYANQRYIPDVITHHELKEILSVFDPTKRARFLPSLCQLQQWYFVVFHDNAGKSLEEIGVRSVGSRVRFVPSDVHTTRIMDMELSRISARHPDRLYKRRRVDSGPKGSVELLIKGLEEFIEGEDLHN